MPFSFFSAMALVFSMPVRFSRQDLRFSRRRVSFLGRVTTLSSKTQHQHHHTAGNVSEKQQKVNEKLTKARKQFNRQQNREKPN